MPLLRALGRAVAPVFRWLGMGFALVLLLGLLVSLASLILCDRFERIYMILYVPTLPISLSATIFFLLFRRSCFPKRTRRPFIALSLIVLLWSTLPMIGWWPGQSVPQGYTTVRVIQWNVMSGGQYRNRRLPFLGNPDRLKAKIQSTPADIIVFSEAPSGRLIDEMLQMLGPEWNMQFVSGFPDRENKYDFDYFARSMVMSRYPVRRPTSTDIPHGVMCRFEVDMPGRVVRILLVDGDSRPYHKTPYLQAVSDEIARAKQEGNSYDIICGDFNAVSRSVGFNGIAGAGYVDASRYGLQWRGTFPVVVPLLDIDHVFVEPSNVVNQFDVFSTMASDHRGHSFTLGLAPQR